MGSSVGRKSNGNSASHAQHPLTPGAILHLGIPSSPPKHPSLNKLFPPSGPQGQASWFGLSGYKALGEWSGRKTTLPLTEMGCDPRTIPQG